MGSAETQSEFNLSETTSMPRAGRFRTTLFRYPGKGGWTFAPIPHRYAPAVTHGWGRTPVEATLEGHSVWRGKDARTLLAVPKHVRGEKGDGDVVMVRRSFPHAECAW